LIPKNGAKLLMKKPQVDQLLCTRCGICVTVCPTDAIDSHTLDIASKQCIRCFACVKNCTFQARDITPRFPFVAGILNRQGGILKKNQFCGVKTKV
jgi:ferredoxin